MAINYAWVDAESTLLKCIDDSKPDTTKFFPTDTLNRDYRAYLEWVAEGNTALPYVEPPEPVDARTDAEKLEDAMGLTVAEIKAVLGIY